MTVLIIDDDPPLRAFLEILARNNGHQSEALSPGESALLAIQSGKYAAVILNLVLANMAAFKILHSLHATHPHLLRRIIVITDVSQIALDNCGDFQPLVWQMVRKPFAVAEFIQTVATCVRFHSPPVPERVSRPFETI